MKKNTKVDKGKKGLRCLGGEQCKILGYCVRARQQEIIEQKERDNKYRMDERFIGNLVPLTTRIETWYHLGKYSRQHLQTAFDAYHQQDYETAILHSKAVIDANVDCGIAYICLISAEYFLGNYEDATYFASRAEQLYFSDAQRRVLKKFALHCGNLVREKLKGATKTESSTAKTAATNFIGACL